MKTIQYTSGIKLARAETPGTY